MEGGLAEFFEMGGYARYVWGSYGAFAVLILGLVVWTLRRSAATRRELAEIEKQEKGE